MPPKTTRKPARPKALVLAPFAEESLARLRERFAVTYEPWTATGRLHNPADLAQLLRRQRIEAVVVEADFLTREAFEAPSLRIAGVCRDGLNLIDLAAATELGIPVLRTPARNAPAVAELTIGLMIAVARHIPAAHAYVSRGGWTNPLDPYKRFQGRELLGSVVGIVGFGQMGRAVAERVQCLGARAVAFDPYVTPAQGRALGARMVSLPQLLREADFVSLHTPQNAETENLIDAAALDLMKPTAFLVSIGAAKTVDLDALYVRLRDRRIAGAALDVFPNHMMALDNPLRELDNVILTPHIGGATPETIVRHSKMIVEDIERFLAGKRPRRVANPDALKATRRGR